MTKRKKNRFIKTLTRRFGKTFSHRDGFMICTGVCLALLVMLAGRTLHREKQAVALPYHGGGVTIGWIPPTVNVWQKPIQTMAQRYNIDPNLIAIIMTMESGGYAKADSGQAQGLMQITPLTAQDIASKYLKKPVKTYDIWDPTTNIEFGAAYLAHLRDVFGDATQAPSWNTTVELIAAGYNGGPGAASSLEHGEGLHDMQTVAYSRDAYNMWRERGVASSPTFDRWKDRGGIDLITKAQSQNN